MTSSKPPTAPHRLANAKAVMILSLVACSLVSGLAFGPKAVNSGSSACVCGNTSDYNHSLPASHPNNRCASQSQDLSWQSWLGGSSRSSQFHFLDLLELLHGHSAGPVASTKG